MAVLPFNSFYYNARNLIMITIDIDVDQFPNLFVRRGNEYKYKMPKDKLEWVERVQKDYGEMQRYLRKVYAEQTQSG